ncbi:MAG: ChbG/HpnK family deacetylase [Candidatus Saccharicenans sp.]|nr:ChbG/HpnK family deacetylase [Candidatus Saccharicenans sp.]MDI6849636.1 ChbG/HpnK family deacetylase [Candidatus Saccharicenans sp.]
MSANFIKKGNFIAASAVILSTVFFFLLATAGESVDRAVELVVRGDDMGMTQAANEAFEIAFNQGILTAGGIIVPAPWFEDAARRCRENRQWSVGVHLCVNAEWKDYRWRPVLPYNLVPSLVDEDGYFFPTARAFMARNPQPEELEKELRAQLDRALDRGLRLDYLDTHMDSLETRDEFRGVVRKLAREYGLPISGQCGEDREFFNIYDVVPELKEKVLLEKLQTAKPGLYLLVVHPGLDTPEERAIVDLNPDGLKEVYRYRSAEVKAITSPKIKRAIARRNIKLLSYRDLREQGRVKIN